MKFIISSLYGVNTSLRGNNSLFLSFNSGNRFGNSMMADFEEDSKSAKNKRKRQRGMAVRATKTAMENNNEEAVRRRTIQEE